MKNFISNSRRIIVEDYPYGFKLRTTLYDYIEFDAKKGFRHVTQTVNPKNGALNKPKKSTYSALMVRYYNEDGHIKTTGTSMINGLESINYVVKIFPEISKFLTVPQKEYLRSEIYSCLIISFKAQIMYTSVTGEQAKPLFEPLVNVIREDLKNNTYNFLDLDFKKLHTDLKQLEDPTYNPFKTVSHHNFDQNEQR